MGNRIKKLIARWNSGVTIGVICILVIAFVLLYTSVRNSRLSEESADEAVHSISEFYLQELGERRAQTIATRIDQMIENLGNVFDIAKRSNLKDQNELRQFLQMVKALYGYDKLAVVDENEILYTEHATISGVSRYSFLTEKITKPSIYTANLYGARKQMILAMPLKGIRFGKKKLKLSFIQLDLASILEEITKNSENADTISNVYYNNGEDLISFSNRGEDQANNILHALREVEYMDNHSFTQLKEDFRYGRAGFVSFRRGGVINYMYYTPVKNTNWMFTVMIYESSISNNISDIRDKMMSHNATQLIIIIVVMVMAFTLFLLYSRRMQQKEKKTLVKLSQTDAMTGLYNRGGGEKAIRTALFDGEEGVFFLLDADKFKSINDTYGHDVGDQVIISIADSLKKSFRGEDIVMRLGGDEFAVYAPGVLSEEAADRVIGRLFSTIDAIDIPALGDRKICVSLGAAFWRNAEALSFDELYKRSDLKLYDSKLVEGNRVNYYQK